MIFLVIIIILLLSPTITCEKIKEFKITHKNSNPQIKSLDLDEINISLVQGWNLITIPFETNYCACSISQNLTGCLTVNKWDEINQTYHPYIVDGPDDFNFEIAPGMGLFIYIDNENQDDSNCLNFTYQDNLILSDIHTIHGTCNDGEYIYGTAHSPILGGFEIVKINRTTLEYQSFELHNLTQGTNNVVDYCIFVEEFNRIYAIGRHRNYGDGLSLVEFNPNDNTWIERGHIGSGHDENPGGLVYAFNHIWAATEDCLIKIDPLSWNYFEYDYSSCLSFLERIHWLGANNHNLWMTTTGITDSDGHIFKIQPDIPEPSSSTCYTLSGISFHDDNYVDNEYLYLSVFGMNGQICRFNMADGAIDQFHSISDAGQNWGVFYNDYLDLISYVTSYNSTSNKQYLVMVNPNNISEEYFRMNLSGDGVGIGPNELVLLENDIFVFYFMDDIENITKLRVINSCDYYSDYLFLSGELISNININLSIGWNMIGWYHNYDTTASSLSENITGCLTVNSWDALNQTYKPYIVGGPPDFDFQITAGMGLFVEVDTESTWSGE